MSTLQQPAQGVGAEVDERLADVLHTTIQLGGLTIEVDEVGVRYARAEIPSLIRASAKTGRVFHIRNAKNPAAPTAPLVSPEALEKLVFAPVRRRTLGEVLKLLPFKHTGAPRLRVAESDNAMRALRVPTLVDSTKG